MTRGENGSALGARPPPVRSNAEKYRRDGYRDRRRADADGDIRRPAVMGERGSGCRRGGERKGAGDPFAHYRPLSDC